jgi:hypothetical protein
MEAVYDSVVTTNLLKCVVCSANSSLINLKCVCAATFVKDSNYQCVCP